MLPKKTRQSWLLKREDMQQKIVADQIYIGAENKKKGELLEQIK